MSLGKHSTRLPSIRIERLLSEWREVAAKRGVPRAQVALAWLFSKPFMTAPIVGASKPNHLEDAVAAVSLKLSDDEIKTTRRTLRPTSRSRLFLTVTR